ncbi:MAG: serine/threonine-protein kinase [Phycisphaeraceae bacterium]
MNSTLNNQGFRYQSGERPLEGYTIKRAAGRGGFGEVYYAVSDSGREVALKAVQGFADIELRGIAQCMNLKSPHLVSIFDVRTNDQGVPFVIMEYVAGPNLRQLIDVNPSGLGEQKTAFFLREIGKGLAYLHDSGIVHRDLKPGNIFYDEGYVKIGDYGLAKAMAASPQQSQTVTVGTVHYMAPEIGAGRYDRGIDIYALGVLVYEMLTGQVPFFGSSPAEILMKHLGTKVDASSLPAPFDRVVARAMAKDPAERYQDVRAMVEDVFGSDHIRQSVLAYGAEDLTVYARRAAEKVGGGDSSGEGLSDLPDSSNPDTWQVARAAEVTRRVTDGSGRVVGSPPKPVQRGFVEVDESRDPIGPVQRAVLSLMTLMVLAGGVAALLGDEMLQPVLFMATVSLAFGQWFGLWRAQRWLGHRLSGEWLLERIGYGSLAAAMSGGMVFPFVVWFSPATEELMSLWFGTAAALFVMGSYGASSAARTQRISLVSALGAFLVAWVVVSIMREPEVGLIAGVTAAAVALAFRVNVPFDPEASQVAYPRTAVDRAVAEERSRIGQPSQKESEQIEKRAEYRDAPSTGPGPVGLAVASGEDPIIDHDDEGRPVRLSPRSRLLALIFVAAPMTMVPIFGLHRFYAGKIGTGILWLLTGGLLGIGQLIDGLFIVAGHFEDGHDRRVRTWWPGGRRAVRREMASATNRSGEVASGGSRWTPADYVGSAVSAILGLLAYVTLLASAAVAAVWLFGLPYAVSAFDPALDMDGVAFDLFGNSDWQRGILALVPPVSITLLLSGVTMLTLARRLYGVGHMIRGILGVAMISLAVLPAADLFGQPSNTESIWLGVTQRVSEHHVPDAVFFFFQSMSLPELVIAQVFVLIGVLFIAWPARRLVEG